MDGLGGAPEMEELGEEMGTGNPASGRDTYPPKEGEGSLRRWALWEAASPALSQYASPFPLPMDRKKKYHPMDRVSSQQYVSINLGTSRLGDSPLYSTGQIFLDILHMLLPANEASLTSDAS